MQKPSQMSQVVDDDEADFKLGILLHAMKAIDQSAVFTQNIDADTQKLSTDEVEVYLKNNKVVLVIDKRNPSKKVMYNDINTAYSKVIGL